MGDSLGRSQMSAQYDAMIVKQKNRLFQVGFVCGIVASRGFEPRQAEPKSVVLPLHHEAIRSIAVQR